MYTVHMNSNQTSTMYKKPLTDQQQTVLNFLTEFVQDQGYPPTLREIGDAVGLANVNAVRGHLAALEKKGYITKTPDKARSIQLVQAPSRISRFKRRFHEVVGTDKGVFHRVVYGLAWTTHRRAPFLTGPWPDRLRKALSREAVEHGWTILETRIEPDHLIVVVETWPNHAAQKTVQRLQSAANGIKRSGGGDLPGRSLWGKGYAVTTDLELLDKLVVKLLKNEQSRDSR